MTPARTAAESAAWWDAPARPLPLPPALGVPAVARLLAFAEVPDPAPGFAAAALPRPAAIARSVAKRQAEYLAGRLCARAALDALGVPGPVGTGPAREPLWPAGAVGAITHAAGRAAAVAVRAADCAGIGIDLETVMSPALARETAGAVATAAEAARLDAERGTLSWEEALTLVFSAKESFFKAAFGLVGRHFDFDGAELVALAPDRGCLELAVRRPLAARLPPGSRWTCHFAWIAPHTMWTVCALRQGQQ